MSNMKVPSWLEYSGEYNGVNVWFDNTKQHYFMDINVYPFSSKRFKKLEDAIRYCENLKYSSGLIIEGYSNE